jgi:DNA-binding GntR family transcriptional regulator
VNYREHALLFKAIEEHNVEEAVRIMTEHMQNLMAVFEKMDCF